MARVSLLQFLSLSPVADSLRLFLPVSQVACWAGSVVSFREYRPIELQTVVRPVTTGMIRAETPVPPMLVLPPAVGSKIRRSLSRRPWFCYFALFQILRASVWHRITVPWNDLSWLVTGCY
jgi:hypothetical protein